jgi:hypothetical protein
MRVIRPYRDCAGTPTSDDRRIHFKAEPLAWLACNNLSHFYELEKISIPVRRFTISSIVQNVVDVSPAWEKLANNFIIIWRTFLLVFGTVLVKSVNNRSFAFFPLYLFLIGGAVVISVKIIFNL